MEKQIAERKKTFREKISEIKEFVNSINPIVIGMLIIGKLLDKWQWRKKG